MKNRLFDLLAVLIVGTLGVVPMATAADLVREARIASQIQDAILEGEVVWLQAGEARFLAIYTPASTPDTRGAAVLLHGSNAHPDWMDVIYPLRTQLPAHGWATLSIQLPVTAPDAPPDSWQQNLPLAAPRIAAAAAWLKQKQLSPLVLIGHSLGARMGTDYLGGLYGAPDPAFQAFVAIGLSADPAKPDTGALKALRQIRLPVLDLYGQRDLAGVIASAAARQRAGQLAGTADFTPDYTQVQVPGADHFFHGLDNLLVSRVRAWLSRVTAPAGASQTP
jgi:pimeloyl-ACP methyl ester carboxylesterase